MIQTAEYQSLFAALAHQLCCSKITVVQAFRTLPRSSLQLWASAGRGGPVHLVGDVKATQLERLVQLNEPKTAVGS